ncbi:MAG: crotonase/enoyl-CoA hydratase family protein [Deltaproteobacteria bacterium]|nr:crotonase/enoyl-CoA hydratase family protein [Deltaproteobacteria bacterium]
MSALPAHQPIPSLCAPGLLVAQLDGAPAVWLLQLRRPARRNAIDPANAAALLAAAQAFDADPAAAVGVLCGAEGSFCAGADLQAIHEGDMHTVAPGEAGPLGPTRLLLRKPLIAAIEGHAVAGGLELALWCDLRVGAEDCTLGVFCRRFGVPLVDGGTARLPRLIGLSRALDLILTGRPVRGPEALQMGLLHRLTAPGGALAEAVALATALCALPQETMRNDREAAIRGLELPFGAALDLELELGLRSLSADTQAGAAAFVAGAGRHGAPRS